MEANELIRENMKGGQNLMKFVENLEGRWHQYIKMQE